MKMNTTKTLTTKENTWNTKQNQKAYSFLQIKINNIKENCKKPWKKSTEEWNTMIKFQKKTWKSKISKTPNSI